MATEVYECTVSGVLAGQFVQTVLHASADVPPSTDPFTVAKEFLAEISGAAGPINSFCNALPTDYRITSLRCSKVAPVGGPTAFLMASALLTNVGQRTGTVSSAQVNPLLTWIGTTTPNRTGRVFMPGVSEDDIDEMQLVPALVTAIEAFAASWKANVTTSSAGQFLGVIYRRATKVGDLINNYQVSPLIGTQRRRLRPF